MNKNTILGVLIGIALIIGLGVGAFVGYDIGYEKAANNGSDDVVNGSDNDSGDDNAEEPEEPFAYTSDVLRVDLPLANSEISSPVVISGEAVGPWFFEASFTVDIVAEDGTVLGQSFVQAQSEWMTENFVPFEGEILFDAQGYDSGFIVFNKANASGLPEHDDSRQMPVQFSN